MPCKASSPRGAGRSAIRPFADTIDGVDLSPGMVRAATASGLYHRVRMGDAAEALASTTCSLILAADVMVYIKDLNPLLQAAAQALDHAGLFAFTVQAKEGDGVHLGPDLRFHHSAAFLRTAAAAAQLDVLVLDGCVTRQDAGLDVPGFVVVLGRRDG
jgi:predicted TPR repeat methyltransferase